MTKSHIHILKTGGTIEFHDPAYEDINNILLKLDASIDSYLDSLIRPHFSYSIEQVFSKDSRDINTEDRNLIVDSINKSIHDKFIITHGTFTMRESAEYIQSNIKQNATVILTGSMIPITGFASSDAGFNLGFAIGSLMSLEPGVYLAMNGGVFKHSEVSKSIDNLRFE